MDISIDEMRYKIYYAINKLEDTGNIYEILRTMDIPKTTNSNGIFVNLRCLALDQIRDLYTIIDSIKCPQIPEQSLPKIDIEPVKRSQPSQKKYKKPRLTKVQREILSIDLKSF